MAGITADINAEHKEIIHSALIAIDSKNNVLMLKYRTAYTDHRRPRRRSSGAEPRRRECHAHTYDDDEDRT
jgi:hypothetical protein